MENLKRNDDGLKMNINLDQCEDVVCNECKKRPKMSKC